MIKDADLEEYLKDKLLVKPDYPSEIGPTEVPSNFEAIIERINQSRMQINARVKREYDLWPRR